MDNYKHLGFFILFLSIILYCNHLHKTIHTLTHTHTHICLYIILKVMFLSRLRELRFTVVFLPHYMVERCILAVWRFYKYNQRIYSFIFFYSQVFSFCFFSFLFLFEIKSLKFSNPLIKNEIELVWYFFKKAVRNRRNCKPYDTPTKRQEHFFSLFTCTWVRNYISIDAFKCYAFRRFWLFWILGYRFYVGDFVCGLFFIFIL